jgi:hypothetical protein
MCLKGHMITDFEDRDRHYHQYRNESSSDNVCRDIQNWHYCFIGDVITLLNVILTDVQINDKIICM